MGKPAITVGTASMIEIVEEGRTGLMVGKSDAEGMSRAIQLLVDNRDRAREMGLAARKRVTEMFSMENHIKNTLRVYAEAIR